MNSPASLAFGALLALSLRVAPLAAVQAPASLSLDEVVERALQVDPAAAAAEGALSGAHADQWNARGALLPSVNMNLIYGNSSNERFDQSTGRLVSESYTAQLQSSYLLFGGGSRLFDLRSTGARVDVARASLRAQRFQTVLTATRTFYETVAAADLLAAAESRLERAEAQLEAARTRLEVGNATASDLLRAELEVANAELSVIESETARQTAALQLGRMVGLAGEVTPSGSGLPTDAPALPSEEELIRIALESSPEVVSAEAEVARRQAERRTSVTNYLPTVRLTGGYDWFAFQFPPDTRSWSLRLIGSLPVFNGFQRESSLQRSSAELRTARARARDAEIGVTASVRAAVQTILAAERRVDIAQRGVELAREDLRVQEERYGLGVSTIIELQTSQVALAEAEIEAVTARQRLGTSVAELEAILGRRVSGS